MVKKIYQVLFWAACFIGQPFGGIKPHRMYHYFARRGWNLPEFAWHKNKWNSLLFLSPFYYIDRNIIAFGEYDKDLHLAIENLIKPGMTCFDVGANIGEISLHMANCVGITGRVFAFEPVPEIFERLENNIAKNQISGVVEAHQVALSDRTGTAEIQYTDLSTENQGMGSLVRSDEIMKKSATILVTTLDQFMSENSIDRIDIIKMDIQGAEMLMIEGGRQTISNHQPDLFIEISPEDLKFADRDSRDLINLISSFGYRIYEFKNNKIVQEIQLHTIQPDYRADNIFCSKTYWHLGTSFSNS